MSTKLTLKAANVHLTHNKSTTYGPFNLQLASGEGALVIVDNLEVIRHLMRCCMGLLSPDSGHITWWGGRSIKAEDLHWQTYDTYRRIGYVDRYSQLLSAMPLQDMMMLFHQYAGHSNAMERSTSLLERFGLIGYSLFKGYNLPEPVRRLALYALALCGPPRLMLMERPNEFLGKDFDWVWDIILKHAAKSGLAYIVFDQAKSIYSENNFSSFHFVTPADEKESPH